MGDQDTAFQGDLEHQLGAVPAAVLIPVRAVEGVLEVVGRAAYQVGIAPALDPDLVGVLLDLDGGLTGDQLGQSGVGYHIADAPPGAGDTTPIDTPVHQPIPLIQRPLQLILPAVTAGKIPFPAAGKIRTRSAASAAGHGILGGEAGAGG